MQQPPYTITGNADSTGFLHLPFRARGAGRWRVTQTTGEMVTGVGAACALRLNGYLITPLVPTGGAAGNPPYVWVDLPGDEFAVEWTGAPVGAAGKAVFLYDDGKADQ